MTIDDIRENLIKLSEEYNNPEYFLNDPIIFPKYFAEKLSSGDASLQDVEIAGILSSHLAWGRRDMIVRDCNRMFDEMKWNPFYYIMTGIYRDEEKSLHRTIKWSDFAIVCRNLKLYYDNNTSIEMLEPEDIRHIIFKQAHSLKAANKKIHMFRRWMVRNDGVVDLGIWKHIDPADLIIPLDVHVHRTALELGITQRRSADLTTAMEITRFLRKVFPADPCKGDFALFAYTASKNQKIG
ncbi:MAG: DUF2400 domain-containing protein [Bacteroidales bacterium]|jgi:hypothetical protein